jgi:hypothetical protein
MFLATVSKLAVALLIHSLAQRHSKTLGFIVRGRLQHRTRYRTRQRIDPRQLTVHPDNGGLMKGATVLTTFQRLGIVSRSRTQVNNDKPFSESLFKTLKYHFSYPPQPFTDLAPLGRCLCA